MSMTLGLAYCTGQQRQVCRTRASWTANATLFRTTLKKTASCVTKSASVSVIGMLFIFFANTVELIVHALVLALCFTIHAVLHVWFTLHLDLIQEMNNKIRSDVFVFLTKFVVSHVQA